MALRPVLKLPDPVLRRKAHKVTAFDDELKTLIQDMIETMRDEPGVGLAAPQVGVSKRVIVVEYPENDEIEESPIRLYSIANPEIVTFSETTLFGIEGCLSVPIYLGEVERAEKIVVQGFNQNGKKVRVNANGWLARIFQHEIDHLNGILFVDKATRIFKPEDSQTTADTKSDIYPSIE